MRDTKPAIKDYRYIATDMTAQVVGVTLAKYTIAVIPVFIYLMIRQISMSIYLLAHDRRALPTLKEEFMASEKSIKLQIIIFGFLRSMNVVVSYYVFDKMNLSLFSSIQSPINVICGVLLGIVILKERPTLKFYLSILVILTGITLITGFNTSGVTVAILIILTLNGLSTSMCSVLTQRISKTISSQSISFVGIVGPLPTVLIAATVQIIYVGLDWGNEVTWFIVVATILATCCTFIANIMAVKAQISIGATRFQVIKTFSVVLTLLPATLILGDTVTPVQLAGIMLSVIGVILVVLARTKTKQI